MYKTTSKTSLFLASCMLSIIVLSLVSSIILYRQLTDLQSSPVNTELVDFISEFERELDNTSVIFSKAYRQSSDSDINREFDGGFSKVMSRSKGLEILKKRDPNIDQKVDTHLIIYNINKIQSLVYHSDLSTNIPLAEVSELLSEIAAELHHFQIKWGYHNQHIGSHKHKNTLASYQNTVLLIFVTLIIGIVMVLYLFSNNRKLLELRRTLEQRVYERTKELNFSNSNLLQEVSERKKIEQELTISQHAAEKAHQRIKHQTNYDSLTKLANRSLFIERFKEASRRADRNDNLVSLLFLDLDRFKYVNDTLGHSIGDELLKEAALRIQDVLRSTDTAARFGGDEFAVVLSDIDEISTVELIVSRILKTLSSPFRLSGNDAFVSASIGITMYPTDGDNNETLLGKADSAMYKAKEAGSNNYQFFTQQMDVEATERRLLEGLLYQAVEDKQFQIEYQPIFDVKTNQTMAFEALVYWNHPSKGKLSAEKFIPLAEEVGLILPIGEWVLFEACKTAVSWAQEGDDAFVMSVNVSSRHFQKCNMLDVLEKVMNDTGLAPNRLMIEITEELLISDRKQTLEQLKQIRKLGVQIAIDGFGTGYSSLSFLKKYPISTLKIDESFVDQISIESADDELIKGILSMADKLNLSVIASGVKNVTQLQFLDESECCFAQGPFLANPLRASDALPFLKEMKKAAV
jgi:diguanylate cyclase (GGDEF)-like protein